MEAVIIEAKNEVDMNEHAGNFYSGFKCFCPV
jgi:hypothetical protein